MEKKINYLKLAGNIFFLILVCVPYLGQIILIFMVEYIRKQERQNQSFFEFWFGGFYKE